MVRTSLPHARSQVKQWTRYVPVLLFICSPLIFSLGFSRLYSRNVFLFFSDPRVDDEGYFDHLNVWFSGSTYSPHPSPTCRVPRNYRGIGAASLWVPGYTIFKLGGRKLKGLLGLPSLAGDQILRLGAATTNFFIAIGIQFLAYRILSRYVSPFSSVIFSLVTVMGGMLPYYLFRRPLMSHAAEAFYFLLSVYGAEEIKTQRDSNTPYALTGIGLAGLLATRLQAAPVVAVMLLFLMYELRDHWKRLGVLLLSLGTAFTPQMYVNFLNFGHWLAPSSAALPFMAPSHLFEVGEIQWQRLIQLFIGTDWGLLLMFPWLILAFFIKWAQVKNLWPISKSWILGAGMTILIMMNYKAHGASYGHRYVNLLVISMTLIAALGFDNLRLGNWKKLAYGILFAGLFISLTHYVAFESDPTDFTLRLDHISLEGPVRAEWETFSDTDWVNEAYSRNVYTLFVRPHRLLEKFGAAPLPLYLAKTIPPCFNLPVNSMVATYLAKHHIDFNSYWRYVFLILLGNLITLGGAVYLMNTRRLLSRREDTPLPGTPTGP